MTKIRHLKRADLVISDSDDEWIGYWFEEGISMCVRPMDAGESYILRDTSEQFAEDAVEMLNNGATNENGGDIPNHSECIGCHQWYGHHMFSNLYCIPCHHDMNGIEIPHD